MDACKYLPVLAWWRAFFNVFVCLIELVGMHDLGKEEDNLQMRDGGGLVCSTQLPIGVGMQSTRAAPSDSEFIHREHGLAIPAQVTSSVGGGGEGQRGVMISPKIFAYYRPLYVFHGIGTQSSQR